MTKEVEDIDSVLQRLEDYAYAENSEVSEYWKALLALFGQEDSLSAALSKALEKEIRAIVKQIDRDYVIVETVQTTEHRVRTLEERP